MNSGNALSRKALVFAQKSVENAVVAKILKRYSKNCKEPIIFIQELILKRRLLHGKKILGVEMLILVLG